MSFLAGLKFLEPSDWRQLCPAWLPVETPLDLEPAPLAHRFPGAEQSVWLQPGLKSVRGLPIAHIRLTSKLT